MPASTPAPNDPKSRMPAAFIGHGSPMNALEENRFTQAWRAFGRSVPRPRAILTVSAHWYIGASAVTAMSKPRTIHDFYGFPQPLFEVQYPAPGLPELAGEIEELVKPTVVTADADTWGIDHGTWSVLVHAFPEADIPVVQLSINAQQPFDFHVELGRKLAPLREKGVLILGSGNIVHNLRAIEWRQPDHGTDWNARFDAAVTEVLRSRPEEAASLGSHADYRASHPTPDHFIPLLYVAGVAAGSGEGAEVLVQGPAYGSISMTCFTLGAQVEGEGRPSADTRGSAPGPKDVPWEGSNL